MGENKARLVVLIDPKNKAAFDAACASGDLSASEVIRQLIEQFLARHGATSAASARTARTRPPG